MKVVMMPSIKARSSITKTMSIFMVIGGSKVQVSVERAQAMERRPAAVRPPAKGEHHLA